MCIHKQGVVDADMKIIAFDPGYDRCGIAYIERSADGKERLVESTCITTNRKDVFENRIYDISVIVRNWIEKHNPDVCVLETLFFAKNQKTAMRVAEARGALLLTVTQAGVPIHEFTPKEVKVAVTGDGAASKHQVMSMIPRLLSLKKEIKFDDEYDAIAVGLTASAILRNTNDIE